MFLEWLIRSSGVPINGITPFNMTNFYSNYISALGNKTSFTTVQTTMYGTFAPGTPGAPAPTSIVPITSNGTQQIIVKAMASGNVDCDLATTGHLSHINSVSQPNPPSGDMWLTIDNSLDMGEAPSYSNAPFNSGTTTFRISSTGTITPYSGVGTNFNNPEDSNWEDPGSYATFVVVCHKLS
jgi:hypothetical protein